MHAIRRILRSVSSPRPCLVAAVVVLCVLIAAEALACPNCKDAVNTTDPDGLNVARGYFYSILIMLAMPFTLVGSFGVYVWREMQRQKRPAVEGTGESVDPLDPPGLEHPPNAARS